MAVLARFDVVAVQEARGNLTRLRHALKRLGPAWGMILTDVTRGREGNDERLASLFDTRRVRLSGLACELVLPAEDGARQFARTPYATGSHGVPELTLAYTGRAGGVDFVPHVLPGLTRRELSWRISDHSPLWAEFAVP